MNQIKPALGGAGTRKGLRCYHYKDINIFQLIPIKVMLEIHFIEAVLAERIHNYRRDNFFQILSTISYCGRKPDDEYGGWAPLRLEYLRAIVPKADQYLQHAISLGIVQRSSNYIVGERSYLYQIGERYESELDGRAISDKVLLNRILKSRLQRRSRLPKGFPDQRSTLRSLDIDLEALQYVKSLPVNSKKELRKKNYAICAYYKMMDKHLDEYVIDKTSYRAHSKLTRLPKGLRRFLSLYGLKLLNIDVRNCQPFISTIILTNPSSVAFLARSKKLKAVLNNIKVKQTEDVQRYIKLVSEGQFYRYMKEQISRHGLNYSEAEVKIQMLIILFDRNQNTSKAKQIFEELFPEVNRVFKEIRGMERGSKYESYERFSILLQRIESYVMLEKVMERLNREHPEIEAMTIHDSILLQMKNKNIERVKKIITEEFEIVIGIKPLLKLEKE